MKFFTKRNQLPPEIQERLPPRQRLAKRWPVLTYGETPTVEMDTWRLRLFGEVEAPVVFTWDDVMAMPQADVRADMHCVTRWSKLDNVWQGVSLCEVLQRVRLKPAARYVMVHAYGGYMTNLPLAALAVHFSKQARRVVRQGWRLFLLKSGKHYGRNSLQSIRMRKPLGGDRGEDGRAGVFFAAYPMARQGSQPTFLDITVSVHGIPTQI